MSLFKRISEEPLYIEGRYGDKYHTDNKNKKVFTTRGGKEVEIPSTDEAFSEALIYGEEIKKEQYA